MQSLPYFLKFTITKSNQQYCASRDTCQTREKSLTKYTKRCALVKSKCKNIKHLIRNGSNNYRRIKRLTNGTIEDTGKITEFASKTNPMHQEVKNKPKGIRKRQH